MASSMADRFMQALQAAEKTGELDGLAELFSDQAELKRLTGAAPATGQGGARQFWQEYLGSFRRIRSEFTNVIECGRTVVLEWVSEAEPQTGPAFHYEGVSVLEVDQDRVQRFRTYYDTARFVPAATGTT